MVNNSIYNFWQLCWYGQRACFVSSVELHNSLFLQTPFRVDCQEMVSDCRIYVMPEFNLQVCIKWIQLCEMISIHTTASSCCLYWQCRFIINLCALMTNISTLQFICYVITDALLFQSLGQTPFFLSVILSFLPFFTIHFSHFSVLTLFLPFPPPRTNFQTFLKCLSVI